jgi:hypothetical protein
MLDRIAMELLSKGVETIADATYVVEPGTTGDSQYFGYNARDLAMSEILLPDDEMIATIRQYEMSHTPWINNNSDLLD